jgi:error-prone DNA polymerase
MLRPGTAKGFVFLTLEDETGISQAIVKPDLFRDHRALIFGSRGLIVEGVLQNEDGQCSVRGEVLAVGRHRCQPRLQCFT